MFARYATKALFATAAVAATLVFVVSPASAETRTRAVSYADLDLQSDAGVNRLNRRIKSAARYVCGPIGSREYSLTKYVMDCRADAIANANRAVVTVLATAKSGDRLALRSGSISVVSN